MTQMAMAIVSIVLVVEGARIWEARIQFDRSTHQERRTVLCEVLNQSSVANDIVSEIF